MKYRYLLFTLLLLPLFISPSFVCTACHFTLNTILKFYTSDAFINPFEFLIDKACSFFLERKFCDSFLDFLAKPIYRHLIERLLNPNITCTKLELCKSPLIVLDSNENYMKRKLMDKPPMERPKVRKGSPKFHFAVFTDAHLDLNYTAGSEADCQYPLCCRVNVNQSSPQVKVKAGKWGTVAKCDLPKSALDSFVDYMANLPIVPDFILWLGDNPAHDVWDQQKKTYLDPQKYITLKLQEKFGHLGQVYPVLGNHEGYPCDEFDVYSNSHQWLLDNSTDMWKQWLTEDSQKTLRKLGSYSQMHKDTKLRIITLFPLVADTMNPYLWKNSTNVWSLLDWFENELLKSEKNNEAVYVIHHFPPNTWFFLKQWNYRYGILLERYSNIIRGVFSGHTHEDSFELIKSKNNKNEVDAVVLVHPALTTQARQNPSFRIYEVDQETFTLLDYYQYRLNISESDKKDKPIWEIAYQFTTFYQVKDMEYENFATILKRMMNENDLFVKMMDKMWSDGPRGPEFIAKYGKNALSFIYCRFHSSDLYEVMNCMGSNYLGFENILGYGIAAKYVVPEWEIALF